jgi:hypothetical protein
MCDENDNKLGFGSFGVKNRGRCKIVYSSGVANATGGSLREGGSDFLSLSDKRFLPLLGST